MFGDSPSILVLCLLVTVCVPSESLKNIDVHSWQQSYNENQKLIVFFPSSSACTSCEKAKEALTAILGQPEVPEDLEIGESTDPALLSKLGIQLFPGVVYLREKSYVFYDGRFDVEELIEWIQLATQPATHLLNDDSFEHLTQASTGATTGDWLVAFYTPQCQNILTVMETLGVKIRRQTNVAKVNSADSKILAERFRITECPEIILFRQGRMYRYNLPKIDVRSLKSFVEGFYKNVKAENVPGQKSSFDYLTESIADSIKTQLNSENRVMVLAGIAGVAGVFFLVLICCCRSLVGEEIKQKSE